MAFLHPTAQVLMLLQYTAYTPRAEQLLCDTIHLMTRNIHAVLQGKSTAAEMKSMVASPASSPVPGCSSVHQLHWKDHLGTTP